MPVKVPTKTGVEGCVCVGETDRVIERERELGSLGDERMGGGIHMEGSSPVITIFLLQHINWREF